MGQSFRTLGTSCLLYTSWVEKIKAAYPEIEALDNDALRAKTEELKKYSRESATDERAKVEELKASIRCV